MTIIYESPDSGNTVYARASRDTKRKLIKKRYEDTWNEFTFQYDWDYMSEKHPAIREKLEELKVITQLCNENKS
jgi:hypothetical protein